MEQLINVVLSLEGVTGPSVEQTADVPIVEKDLLVDEPEDAVDVVEDVVDAPGPTVKQTLDLFVSQFPGRVLMNWFHVIWKTWWRQFSPILVPLRSVEHMVSIIARATCNGQQINGCTGSCRFVLLAISCSWLAGSWSGAAACKLGSSYRQTCAR